MTKPTEAELLAAHRQVRVDPEALCIATEDLDAVIALIANALAARRVQREAL